MNHDRYLNMMKKIMMGVATVLLVSCGGSSVKLTPESEAVFAEARGGLL